MPATKPDQKKQEKQDNLDRFITKGGDVDNGFAKIRFHRPRDMSKAWITLEDRTIAEFEAPIKGDVICTLLQEEGIKFTGDVVTSKEETELIESAWLADQGTNWRGEKDGVIFTNPISGQSLKLPKADQSNPHAIYVPKGVPQIYGQPDMIFSLTMGMHYGVNTLLSGPTGTGKTTAYAFLAQTLGYNFIRVQIDPKTEGAALVGEYLPAGTGTFEWCDGPITEAVRLSQHHPTIFILDEISRIGNVAELARIYSLLDDARELYLPERKHEQGQTERIKAGVLFIGATMNPAHDEKADYIGVRELDPALMSRFSFAPEVGYPKPEIEIKTLKERVPGLSLAQATRMVKIGNAIRTSAEIHYPFSFRELVAWAQAIPFYDFQTAAKVSFIKKAHPVYQKAMLDKLGMQ